MSGHRGTGFNVGGFITLAVVLLLSIGIAGADQIPGNCNATGLQFTTVREKTLVTLGEVNRYTVSVTNNDNAGAGSLACDTENVLVVFCCPDVDGHAPNEDPGFDPDNPGPLCTVLSDGFGDGNPADRDDFPANFGTRVYATQECVIDGFFVSGSSKRANVKVQAGFDDLQYGLLHDVPGESPLNREDVLGVTVAECAVQVDKAVACNGVDYVDQTLVSGNEDGTNDCYGWNDHDADGDGSNDGAEPLNLQYQAQNIGDPGAALFGCQIVESNGAITNVPIDVGDLADGQASSPFTIPGSCDENYDDGEPDTATVTCFCIDPGSPDFDPGLTASANDLAEFDCQTPSLTISKNCTDDLDSNGQFPVDITVTNNGDATLINCVVTDTAVADDDTCPGDGAGTDVPLTPVGGFNGSLAPGQSKQFTGAVDVLAVGGFANNAHVVCEIADENGQPVLDPNNQQAKTITRDDCDTCETTCEVELDKQVSCDNKDINDPTKVWYDVTGNDDDAINSAIGECYGWNAFNTGDGAQAAEAIDVRYVVSNNGQTGLYSCELTDSNGMVTPLINVPTIIAGGSDTLDVANSCSDALDDGEPDTASVSCLCVDDPQTDIPPVEDEDSASFECQTPDLAIDKDCVDQLDSNNQFPVDITVNNPGTATLINCVVTDAASPADGTCPTDGSVNVPLTPVGGFDGTLIPAASQDFDGAVDVLALDGFANGATVTCQIADENGNPVLDEAGAPKTITRDDCDTCNTTCEVELDKQVSCDGKDPADPTKAWVDVTDDDDNAAHTLIQECWGWNAFDNGDGGQGAEPLDVRYVISNNGLATLYACEVTDSNGAVTGPIDVGDIGVGGSSTQDVPLSCSESLDDGEPDTGAVSCLCVDDVNTDLIATDDDQASFDCQTPELRITKDCLAPNVDGIDDIEISVFNDGDADLLNCFVVDEVYQGSASCGAPGAGDLLNLVPDGPFNPADFDLGSGNSVNIDSAVSVMADSCNRATVVCEIADHNGNPVLDPATGQAKRILAEDDDLCEPPDCMVEVDKQVSCDGGDTWLDMGLQTANDDGNNAPCVGWNAFIAPDGSSVPAEQILVRYRAHNDSPITVYDCTLNESNNGLPGVGPIGDLTPGETQDFYFPDGSGADCTANLADDEPDTATLTCFCSEARDTNFQASATDGANFDCQTPGLEVVKTCGDPNEELGTVPFEIRVTNTSVDGADLANCVVSDEIFLDDPTCPAGPAGTGTDIPLDPDNIPDLPAGSSSVIIAGDTTCPQSEACNTATVTCDIVGSVDPATGGAKTITSIADDLCQPCGEGCLSRTPGFWGTHPHVTEKFLPLQNCGITIDNTYAMDPGSSAEDMCWGGRDFKTADTSASQLQLIRQCMAAHLNIAATTAGAGNCDSSYPNISATIDSCCEDLCTTGPDKGEISASSCIGLLDAFNNSNDTLDPFGDFIRPGPAQPGECREANGNGWVNPGRNLGPRQ